MQIRLKASQRCGQLQGGSQLAGAEAYYVTTHTACYYYYYYYKQKYKN